MSDEHIPVLVFTEKDNSFNYGFEAGVIWHQLLANPPFVGEEYAPVPINENNIEIFQAMADFFDYAFECQPSNLDGWLTATFTKNLPKPKFVPTIVRN